MTDPRPDMKDCFVSTFENLLVQEHEIDANDEKLREEIRQRINTGELNNERVSSDK